MRNQPVPLVTGFYADQDRPFSQQDVWNYLPCRAEKEGARSPLMLKTPPGLYPWLELEGAPPVRGLHDCEGRLFAVIGTTLYRITPKGVALPIGTIPGNGRVSMDHNQRANGQQLTVVNGSAGYVYDTYADTFERITDTGFPGSPVIRFMDGYMIGLDPAGRFAFSSAAANALDYNTLDRWTSEYRPDRLVSMARLGGELLLLSANSGEFFGVTGAAQQPFRSKRLFLDKGCAGPHTVVEADNTVFWLGSDGYFYQLDGYNSRRISTRPIEQAIRGLDWWNAFAFVWESEGHTVVYWTFLDGQTWGWDTSQQEWHRRESYGLDRWRPSCTARSNGAWYAGDFQKGRIWRLDWGYPWEGDTEFVSGFTLPVIHDNQNELVHSRLEVVMDVGQVGVESSTFPEQPVGPSITGEAPDGLTGIAYTPFAYTISAGDAPGVSVKLVSGQLPPGLSHSNGTLTGTPSQSGVYTFTLMAQDANGLRAWHTDTIGISDAFIAFGSDAFDQIRSLLVPNYADWSGSLVGVAAADGAIGIPGRALCWGARYLQKSENLGASWSTTSANLGGAGGKRNAAYKDGVLIIGGGINGYYKSLDGGDTASNFATPSVQYANWCGERLITASQYSTKFSYSDSTTAEFAAGTQSFSEGATHAVLLSSGGDMFAFNGCCILGGGSAVSNAKPGIAITTNGSSVTNVTFSDAQDGVVSAVTAGFVNGKEVWIVCTSVGQVFRSEDRFQTYEESSLVNSEPIRAALHDGLRFVIAGGSYDDFGAWSEDGLAFTAVLNNPFAEGVRKFAKVVPA